MNLRSTILGILSWNPVSGYDVKRVISNSEIFHWSGNNNQVYKTLIELRKEGLVQDEVQIQENLPTKKVYSITARGLDELRQSLLEAPEITEFQHHFLVQLAWSEILSNDEISSLLEQYIREVSDRLRFLQGLAVRSAIQPGRSQREKFIWERISENLVSSCQGELDWARQTLEQFHLIGQNNSRFEG